MICNGGITTHISTSHKLWAVWKSPTFIFILKATMNVKSKERCEGNVKIIFLFTQNNFFSFHDHNHTLVLSHIRDELNLLYIFFHCSQSFEKNLLFMSISPLLCSLMKIFFHLFLFSKMEKILCAWIKKKLRISPDYTVHYLLILLVTHSFIAKRECAF